MTEKILLKPTPARIDKDSVRETEPEYLGYYDVISEIMAYAVEKKKHKLVNEAIKAWWRKRRVPEWKLKQMFG